MEVGWDADSFVLLKFDSSDHSHSITSLDAGVKLVLERSENAEKCRISTLKLVSSYPTALFNLNLDG